VIIWLNGGFGAGKTSLAAELRRRLPEAVVFDPEELGISLWKWGVPASDDFQDLASWRELVVAVARSLRRHHAETLIVPMTLIQDDYQSEILGGLANAGEEILHVFLDANREVLRERIIARGLVGDDRGAEAGQSPRLTWAMMRVGMAVAAAGRQPEGTLILRSDRLTTAELADEVLAAAGLGEDRDRAS
jgi:gluconate kinase